MRAFLVTVLWSAVFGTVALACWRAAARNLRKFFELRALPPFDDIEILRAPEPLVAYPNGWPVPHDISEVALASAYRDLAQDRRLTALLLGDVLILAAGGAFGATIADTPHSDLAVAVSFSAVFVGVIGSLVRQRAQSYWGSIATRYQTRLREVRDAATPAAPQVPRRRRWFGR